MYVHVSSPDPDPDPDIRWVWIRRILMHLIYLVHKMIQLMQNWFVDIAGDNTSAPLSKQLGSSGGSGVPHIHITLSGPG